MGEKPRFQMKKFWDWYKTKLAESITFVFVIHVLQLPHMLWANSCFTHTASVCNLNPILDWILYSVDLLEIPSIINVIFLMLFHWKKKHESKRQRFKDL